MVYARRCNNYRGRRSYPRRAYVRPFANRGYSRRAPFIPKRTFTRKPAFYSRSPRGKFVKSACSRLTKRLVKYRDMPAPGDPLVINRVPKKGWFVVMHSANGKVSTRWFRESQILPAAKLIKRIGMDGTAIKANDNALAETIKALIATAIDSMGMSTA